MKLDYDLNTIYAWPLVPRLVVLCVIGIVVFYLGYLFDIKPKQRDLYRNKNLQSALMTQYQQLLNSETYALSNNDEIPKLKIILSNWQDNIVNKKELSVLLEEIIKVGEKSQLKFSLFDPEKVKKRDGYEFTPVRIRMNGTYNQIASFLSDIANMKKMIVVGELIIARAPTKESPTNKVVKGDTKPLNSPSPLTAQVTLEVYQK